MSAQRILVVAAVAACVFAPAAGAQMLGPGMGAPGMGPQGAPPCIADFVPLRDEAQKRGMAIRAAAERKAPREELCTLIRRFAEAEARVVKYVETNKQTCNIPDEVSKEMKGNHGKTVAMRQRVCAGGPVGAEGGPPRPSGPGLSEALGTQRLQLDAPATGRGTFDTLSGSAIKR